MLLDHPFREDNPIAKAIRDVFPHLDMGAGPWVAGGAGRLLAEDKSKLGRSDVDVFFQNETMFNWTLDYLRRERSAEWQLENTQTTPNSEHFFIRPSASPSEVYTFQLLKKRWFETTVELLDNFDFTVTMFATDGHEMVCDPRAPVDLKTRTLILHNPPNKPKAGRLAKYCAHGFIPGPGVATAMLGVNTEKYPFVKGDLTCDEY